MASSRRRSSRVKSTPETNNQSSPSPSQTGKIFLSEEDKRLLRKLNKHLVNKLGLGGNRSVKM